MKTIINCLLLVGFLILAGCDMPKPKAPDTAYHYTNIVAVYYHERGNYSVAYKYGNNLVIEPLYSEDAGWAYIDIVPDVNLTNNMYVDYIVNTTNMSPMYGVHYIIHVHSIDDINTAGWNHGKFGAGTTQRIQ